MNLLTKLFKNVNTNNKIIFIVEDNNVYAKSLQGYLKVKFPNIKEITVFKVGELCLLEMHRNPDIVIMDYFLNSQYEHATNGLEIIKRIKSEKPDTKIILLSAQDEFKVALDAINLYKCCYVQKNQEEAFLKVEQLIKTMLKSLNTPLNKN